MEVPVRKRGWAIARLLISLGLLAFVLRSIGLERIGRVLLQAEAGPLVVALGLFVVGVVVRAVRWRALLVALDLRVPLARLVYLYFVGTFFNMFLPTGFGGDVVRVVGLSQEAQATAVTGTVIVDRLTGLLVLFAMALLALPFTVGLLPSGVWLTIGVVSAGGLVAGGLVLQGRCLRKLSRWLPRPLSLTGQGILARVYDAVTACGWQAVGKALFMSLIYNTLIVLENRLVARAVGMDLSLAYFFVFVPLLSLTLMLPISLGGLGVREGAAVLLFTQVGVDEAMSVAYSLGVYAIARITGLFGGLLFLIESIAGLRRGGTAVAIDGGNRRDAGIAAEGDKTG
jgi:uncharacterized membrane protein YbhN (UPF0104 family)